MCALTLGLVIGSPLSKGMQFRNQVHGRDRISDTRSAAPQIVLQANGISYNARVSGLPASSELCMASWVYKTSANTSSARHVAPLPAAGSHLAGVGPAFGFTAAVNCNQPLQSLPAVVTLSQDLAVPNPASTILGCWSDGTNYTYMLQNPGSSPGTLSASVTSSTPTGLCGWFYDKQGLEIAAASVRSEGEESKMIAIDDDGNGKGRKSGVLAGLAVIVVLLLAMIIAVPLLLLRRKRQQEAALRLQQQAAAGKRPLWDRQNEGTDTSSVALSSATLTSSQQMFPLATRPKHVSKYGLNTT